ncbi:PAS domain-containing protein [Siccirubricoccus sp. G192]|uniref:PAS domain-containing protein n=1 Tax=Siccirubricoccus sp. G192 TaxID=2849651 RepID=UPI001C2BEB42|nr:PAS domain-containing protein [Siccirubricoccus sp. G192]MBV1796775.1 PAS domain-containing protein [Siccirubricoccus sp. G192]
MTEIAGQGPTAGAQSTALRFPRREGQARSRFAGLLRRLAGALGLRAAGRPGQAGAADLPARLAAAEAALAQAEQRHQALTEALGVAIYTTDTEGRLTRYNEAAATLWGWHPPLGDARWCGSWRLYWPDGRPMPHEACPMATALHEGRPVRGTEAVAERPDGTRVPFVPYPTPLFDEAGRLTGAVNVLVDISERKSAELALAGSEAWLRTVFETTPECIKLVAPDGTLLRMNQAGLRMIEAGAPAEVEGRSALDLIAPEHRAEWQANHARVCKGEARGWEFDVIGLRGARHRMETRAAPLPLPDGRLAQLAITRDVTARHEAERRQMLLTREVDHRARNALTVALSLVRLTRAESPRRYMEVVEGRVAALAHAHTLLAERGWSGAEFGALAERELIPHLVAGQVALRGAAVSLVPGAVQAASMVLHELATNAAGHGALSAPGGRLELDWAIAPDGGLRLLWTERGGPPLAGPPARPGFGTKLIESTVRGQLGGNIVQHWEAEGLRCELTIAADRLLPGDGLAAPGGMMLAPMDERWHGVAAQPG